MSLCFRTLPGRLSSLVSGRKPLSKLDRHQSRKHVESFAFLKQFVGTQRALSVRANAISKASIPPAVYALHQNLSLSSLNACSQWNEKPVGRYDDGENRNAIYLAQTRKSQKSQRLCDNCVVVAAKRKRIVSIGITSSDVTMFQAQSVVDNDKNNSFLDNSRILVPVLEGNSRDSRNSCIERGILFTDNMTILKTSQQQSPSSQDNDGKPSQEQLQSVLDCLSEDLPKLFVKTQNYGIYTKDLIFINNIRGVTTKGIIPYVKQLALLKMFGHLKFAHVKLDIIKITMHTEDATVKVRWRIRGVSGMKMLSMFWKYKVWKIRDAIDKYHELWYDGFSTFYVNSEGKIYKHIADKVMPDQDVAEKKEDLRIAPKLALFTGLASMLDSDNESSFDL